MKKLLLLLLIIVTPIFTQEIQEEDLSYHRFGMNVLNIGMGFGASGSFFPLSFYLANDSNQIISFGLDVGLSFLTEVNNYQVGLHVGFGQLYKKKSSNPNLDIGYLIEFSAGFAPSSLVIPYTYVGFSPNFILEIDKFLFKIGMYIDTSLILTVQTGFGFLLD